MISIEVFILSNINEVKTILGFIRSVIDRRISVFARAESLEDIYNYVDIDGLYATSGQPSEAQLEHIVERGYDTVLNLAPTSMLENSVVDERRILEALARVELVSGTQHQDFSHLLASQDLRVASMVYITAQPEWWQSDGVPSRALVLSPEDVFHG